VSIEYYAKLERESLAGVSAGVLDAIARALRLDDAEREHLFNLARAADGTSAIVRRPRRVKAKQWVPRPSLQWTLDAISTRWGAHDVRIHATGTKSFHHPVVGDLTLVWEGLDMTAEPGLVLTIHTAEPGSPSEERLRLLASWAASQYADSSARPHPAE
jgi:hypothetical protein